MKKLKLLLFIPLLITACQQKPATDAAPATSATPDYPYKIKLPDNWAVDTSHTNTMTALTALRAFETKDTTAMKKCFADSMTFNYDGGVFKGTPSQFAKMTSDMTKALKSVKIKMSDWEAVVGKGNKEEWVTMWYTEYNTDLKGKTDSVEYVNDMLFKDGKIARLDEYARHFKMPAK